MSKKKPPKLTRQHKKQFVSKQTQIQERRIYLGPIPEASELAEYEKIYLGATKIIFENFEKQGDHRRSMEKSVKTSDDKNSKRSMFYTFIICLVGVGGAIFLGNNNQLGVSYAIFYGTFGSVGTAFIYSTYTRRKERESKKTGLTSGID